MAGVENAILLKYKLFAARWKAEDPDSVPVTKNCRSAIVPD
jgi:hypothetical protein